jgi:hypothetical protein
MNVVQQFESTAYLSPKHKSHIESRGLLNDWSLPTAEPHLRTRHQFTWAIAVKSGGIRSWVQTQQFQFSQTKPWNSENDGKEKAAEDIARHGMSTTHSCPASRKDPDYWSIENLRESAISIDDHPIC